MKIHLRRFQSFHSIHRLLPLFSLVLWWTNPGAKGADPTSFPAKIDGRWPNDARDNFWFSDYETASRVARQSQRPILLIINRGAPCEV